VWLAVAGVPAGLLLPWSWSGDQRPEAVTAAGIILLGPVLGLLRILLGRLDPAYWLVSTIAAAAGSAIAAVLALPAAARVDGASGIAPGGPVTVLAAAAGAIGWVLVWVAGQQPGTDHQAVALGVAVVAVLALVSVAGIQWYTEDRFVDHTVAPALADAGAALPAQLDRERWRQTIAATSVQTAGRYLVVGQPAGVRVLDATTGGERWSYRRSDVSTRAVAVNDGTAVAVYETGSGVLAVALDVATGTARWRHRHDSVAASRIWRVDRLVPAGEVVIAVPLGGAPGDLVALNAGSGTVRWTWRPERPGGACTVHDVAAGHGVVAVAARCPRDGVARDTVLGLSIVDGKPRWSWEPHYATGIARGDDPTVSVAGNAFLVGYGQLPRTAPDGTPVTVRAPRSSAVLEAATGSVRVNFEAPGRFVAVVGGIALYLGDIAVAVDVVNGLARWTKGISGLPGAQPLAVTGRDGVAYLLLRQPRTDATIPGDSGPLRVVAVDLGSGAVRQDRSYPLGDPGCVHGNDGQLRCDTRPAGIALGPGVAILYQQPARTAPTADLAAMG